MSIWLIGSRGMLGTELEKLLKEKGLPYLATDIEVDITDFKSLRTFIGSLTSPAIRRWIRLRMSLMPFASMPAGFKILQKQQNP